MFGAIAARVATHPKTTILAIAGVGYLTHAVKTWVVPNGIIPTALGALAERRARKDAEVEAAFEQANEAAAQRNARGRSRAQPSA